MLRALLLGAVVALASVAAASSAPPRTVSCDSIVILGEGSSWRPRRVVLDTFAVPPAHIPQTVPSGDPEWPYWSKAGLVVRADSGPVFVSVPREWRSRVAIGWGDVDEAAALRIAPCPPSSSLGDWNPYSGGFVLRTRAACVPLMFRVGQRSATVRFGVGKRCG
jgi:hypothetical protein